MSNILSNSKNLPSIWKVFVVKKTSSHLNRPWFFQPCVDGERYKLWVVLHQTLNLSWLSEFILVILLHEKGKKFLKGIWLDKRAFAIVDLPKLGLHYLGIQLQVNSVSIAPESRDGYIKPFNTTGGKKKKKNIYLVTSNQATVTFPKEKINRGV